MNGLRHLRLRKFLTQTQLAGKIGVRYQTIGSWEAGTSRPRPNTMRQLCEALEVTPDELLAALDTQEAEGKVAA